MMDYDRRWRISSHKYLGIPANCPATFSTYAVSTTATILYWSYAPGPMKRGNLLSALRAGRLGGELSVPTTTRTNGLPNHLGEATPGKATCVNGPYLLFDAHRIVHHGDAKRAGTDPPTKMLMCILSPASSTSRTNESA